jgi:legumain
MNPDNIVVMAYDDIANNIDNPYKGQMFNKPTNALPGVDVYAGCKIDYKGKEVTPDNYLTILKGEKPKGGDGRTLMSGANDTVFLNFADHGAAGLIAFPKDYLYATDLIAALNSMTAKK